MFDQLFPSIDNVPVAISVDTSYVTCLEPAISGESSGGSDGIVEVSSCVGSAEKEEERNGHGKRMQCTKSGLDPQKFAKDPLHDVVPPNPHLAFSLIIHVEVDFRIGIHKPRFDIGD